MDGHRFDQITKHLVGGSSRRQVLRHLGAGLAGALAGAVGTQRAARAQQCTNGTACDGGTGCCVGEVCDTTKKSCGGQCINQDECCTAGKDLGCVVGDCQTATCNNGQCDYQNDPDGSTCLRGICCGGACIRDGECCATEDCTPRACQTATCNRNVCDFANEPDDSTCAGGGICCSGACVSPKTDPNCGTCGTDCPDTAVCAACQGTCTVQAVAKCCPTTKRTNCSGICVNLKKDEANCGKCGRRCRGAKVCKRGRCV